MIDQIPDWFVLVLIVNAAMVLAYSIACLFRKREKSRSWVIRSIVMLLCPIVGFFYFLISWLMYRLVFRRPVDLSDVVFSKERVESAAKADEELERNFVPLEEAIAVTDKKNLRELMLNIVRGNYQESLASIALALDSEDSETSHYAASVLQGALNDFRTNVQRDSRVVLEALAMPEEERTPGEDPEYKALILIDYLNEMLRKRVFTELEQNHYAVLMEQVGEAVQASGHYCMDNGVMEEITLRLLEVKEYEKCEKWALRIAQLYPETLSAYTCRLKLYFSNGEKEKFFEVLNALRQSDVIIDRETLDLIRAFS